MSDDNSYKPTPEEMEQLTRFQIRDYIRTYRTSPDTSLNRADSPVSDRVKTHLAAKAEKLRETAPLSKQAVRTKEKDHEQER